MILIPKVLYGFVWFDPNQVFDQVSGKVEPSGRSFSQTDLIEFPTQYYIAAKGRFDQLS
jgi:hypothetical protein